MRKLLIVLVVLGSAFGAWWYIAVRSTGKTIPQAASEISFPIVGDIVSRITGRGTGFDIGGESDTATPADAQTQTDLARLAQIVPRPVAGFTAFTIEKQSVTAERELGSGAAPKNQQASGVIDFTKNTYVRYVDRSTGYVYEIANDGVPTQISNVYIPNIYEAFFADTGKRAILRFLRTDQKTIASFVVPVPEANADGTRTQQEGFFLPDNIRSFAVSPDTKTMAMLTTNTAGASVVTISDAQNKNRREVMNNAFRDWLLAWTNNDRISVQTKSAGSVSGYFYTIRQNDIRLSKFLGGIQGLTASISPQGNYIIYSQSGNSTFVSYVYNTTTRTARPLSLTILPEKCVWTRDEQLICANSKSVPQGTYPDVWYAGLVSFEDSIVRIDPASLLFSELDTGTESYDATSLVLDTDEKTLYFINKKDSTLWRLRL